MARADFIIIGAMKCGTSTLQVQLAAQRGIFMTTPKEPNFFSDDAIYSQGLSWYDWLFDPAAPGDLKGEASTHYTKLPTYPNTVARMAEALENPKLIYMIRHPVDRAISHFIHAWTRGEVSKNMTRAFRDSSELTSYGCYGAQIEPFLEAFGAKNICLTSLEQLKASPQQELARVTAFLGHAAAPVWTQEAAQQNVSQERIRRLPLHNLLIDSPLASRLRRTLVPKSVRQRIWNARSFGKRPQMPNDLRAKLEQEFLQDRSRLAAAFPGHPALTLCYPFGNT